MTSPTCACPACCSAWACARLRRAHRHLVRPAWPLALGARPARGLCGAATGVPVPDAEGVVRQASLQPGGTWAPGWTARCSAPTTSGPRPAPGTPKGLLSHRARRGQPAALACWARAALALCPADRAMRWTLAGLWLLVLAYVLDGALMPINKSLWTPAFVCLTTGWALIVFAAFYWLLDARPEPLARERWARALHPLVVFGMNALFLYIVAAVLAVAGAGPARAGCVPPSWPLASRPRAPRCCTPSPSWLAVMYGVAWFMPAPLVRQSLKSMHRRHLLAPRQPAWLASCESPKVQMPAPVVSVPPITHPRPRQRQHPPPHRPRVARRLGRHRRQHRLAEQSGPQPRATTGRDPQPVRHGRTHRPQCPVLAGTHQLRRLLRVSLEPWSEYLTGTQGSTRVMTHGRLAARGACAGLELHAWINPYRARQSRARGPAAASHLSRRRPEWVKAYGDQLWVDPASPPPPSTCSPSCAICSVATRRRPAPRRLLLPLPHHGGRCVGRHRPDCRCPGRHPASRTRLPRRPELAGLCDVRRHRSARADWRRDNVNRLVKQLYAVVKLRPTARFGISPSACRARQPPGGHRRLQPVRQAVRRRRALAARGLDGLPRPQLYWPRAQAAQTFEVLLQTWQGLNPRGIPLPPRRVHQPHRRFAAKLAARRIAGQIDSIRRLSPGSGHIHFSLVALAQNRKGVAELLRERHYSRT